MSAIRGELLPALEHLHNRLAQKSRDFDSLLKIGRTHLQDATPMRLGQEFSGHATQMKYAQGRAELAIETLGRIAPRRARPSAS